ncbi:MFS transporter [Streptomyces tsukubensis]|uniref:MFS transporter n=1 Tax=Streptomyces tsukubensis TaxID=83656 RepID=A0A1V4AEK8_9ACTN|nr:MFS transporter [Streptomyces tsukubensis]OON81771.1 MFS transporter [Streptomyces tsukubensis]QFR96556.1 DHA2 family efflux MFS transporter permease subunit [Streptomyces tsukubensis]
MRTWGPLVAVCLGTFMLLLDVTIVIVALPDMHSTLGASFSQMQWVVDIYALALAALLLGAGAAADAVGRRAVYVGGTTLFALASLACGLSTSPGMLIAMRAVQGVGGAAMFATTLSLLGAAYQGRRRSVALGVWGAVSGAAAALGPVLGGMLVQWLDWRWIFLVNVPVSVVAVWLTLRVVAGGRGKGSGRIDWAGTASFTVFAGVATFGVVRAGEEGWTSAVTGWTLALAVLALVVFVVVERRVARPLLDLRLFLRPSFTVVMLGALAFNAAAFGVLPYTSVWLQTLLGMSPVHAGLSMLPLAGVSFVVAAVGGRLLHGVAPRWLLGGGLVLIGAGTLAQAVLDAHSSATTLFAGLAVAGVGTGLVSPALGGAALSSVPPEKAGMAGGAVNTFRQLGYALGVAAFGTVVTSGMTDSLRASTHDPAGAAHTLAGGAASALRGSVPEGALRSAFASGLNGAALVAGIVGIVGGAAVLLLMRPSGGGARGRAAGGATSGGATSGSATSGSATSGSATSGVRL